MSGHHPSTLLDNQERMLEIDRSGMIRLIEAVPEQVREAVRIVQSAELPDWQEIANVLIVGMGGSAIGGNLLRSLVESTCRVPVLVNSDYTIPGFVDQHTLVLVSSYSGNTEESLAVYREAHQRDARIIVIGTGGELAQLAETDGHPWVRLPPGLPPRAAVGYSLITLLLLFERLGLVGDVHEQIDEGLRVLERQREAFGPQVPLEKNPMKQLAVRLLDKIPLIYGSGGWRAVAAYRWKCQVNENSKAVCFWNTFPELNHNETVGWEYPDLTKEIHVVFLRDSSDNLRVQKRIEVTQTLMTGSVAGMTQVWAEGESSLAKLLSLIYPGDFVSYYLALLYGVDPTPIHLIDRLKEELASMDEVG